jgi:hypothetical protein
MLSALDEGQLTMKRLSALALIIGGSTIGLVGGDQTTKTEEKQVITTPGGTETKKITTEDKKTGELKDPAPSTEAPK